VCPKGRGRPTKVDAERAHGHGTPAPIDESQFRKIADALPSGIEPGRTIGEVGGARYSDLVYGDAANYMSAQGKVDPDAVILRLVRRIGQGASAQFQVVTFDLSTGEVVHVGVASNTGRPDSWSTDLKSTAWAD
jgi:hypothetical protein